MRAYSSVLSPYLMMIIRLNQGIALADMGVSAATTATKSTSRTNGKQAGPWGSAVECNFAWPVMRDAHLINFCQLFPSALASRTDFRLEKILWRVLAYQTVEAFSPIRDGFYLVQSKGACHFGKVISLKRGSAKEDQLASGLGC
ncbi:MAG: hypothetical protein J2P21_15830 [Chloracidobacterium sp.]|nr:hypothetical protein [Chloracidobacterium sp.]